MTWASSVATADHVAKTITRFPRDHITRTITPERLERDAQKDSSENESVKARKRAPNVGWWYHCLMIASGMDNVWSLPVALITILPSWGAVGGFSMTSGGTSLGNAEYPETCSDPSRNLDLMSSRYV